MHFSQYKHYQQAEIIFVKAEWLIFSHMLLLCNYSGQNILQDSISTSFQTLLLAIAREKRLG